MYTFYCYLLESAAERRYDIEADTLEAATMILWRMIRMIAKKCDRCGKYYEPYRSNHSGFEEGVNGISFAHMKMKGECSSAVKDRYDLCPECLMAAIAFIKERKKDE